MGHTARRERQSHHLREQLAERREPDDVDEWWSCTCGADHPATRRSCPAGGVATDG